MKPIALLYAILCLGACTSTEPPTAEPCSELRRRVTYLLLEDPAIADSPELAAAHQAVLAQTLPLETDCAQWSDATLACAATARDLVTYSECFGGAR